MQVLTCVTKVQLNTLADMGIRHAGEIGPSGRIRLTAGELQIDGSGSGAGRQQQGTPHNGLWRRRGCLVANEKIGWAASRQPSILSVIVQPGPVSYTVRRRKVDAGLIQRCGITVLGDA